MGEFAMSDMLVNLYNIDFKDKIPSKDIQIIRVLSPNSDKVISYVKANFTDGWASEIKAALYKNQPTCFIAMKDNEIVGFAAYDATAKGYFGPIGVNETLRGKNIGKALILHTLEAMYHDGYGYAIIGGAGDNVLEFYRKTVQAYDIEKPGNVYDRLIRD